MTMRPPDLSFTSAAIRSIIWTDGCVAGTTSLQRIVTCCATALLPASHAVAARTPIILRIAPPISFALGAATLPESDLASPHWVVGVDEHPDRFLRRELIADVVEHRAPVAGRIQSMSPRSLSL